MLNLFHFTFSFYICIVTFSTNYNSECYIHIKAIHLIQHTLTQTLADKLSNFCTLKNTSRRQRGGMCFL